MKTARTTFFIIAAAAAILAGILSFQNEKIDGREQMSNFHPPVTVSVAVDSAKDGGAAGFAILSGLALVAASITFLRKEE